MCESESESDRELTDCYIMGHFRFNIHNHTLAFQELKLLAQNLDRDYIYWCKDLTSIFLIKYSFNENVYSLYVFYIKSYQRSGEQIKRRELSCT